MSARGAVARMLAGPDEWSRRRLQVLLAIAAIVITAVVGGIAWSVIELLQAGKGPDARDPAAADSGAAVLTSTTIDSAQPGSLSTGSTRTIRIPQPSRLGEAQVATGFPESVPGAIGQLIAIDRRAIESASVVTAQDVITAWAAPGGPTPETWSGVSAVRTLLEAAALPADGSTELVIELRPAMALVQGPRPTVCVDFVLSATVGSGNPQRIAVADCQHMAWQHNRWVIAPGGEAPATSSLWPGTEASYDAGYQWLEVEP